MTLHFSEWSTADVNNLPDSSFAYISSGGKKDADGKTTPRSLRHLPYKDKDGKPDLPHVRNALARLEATQIPDGSKPGIRSKLEAILDKESHHEKAALTGIAFEFSEKTENGGIPTRIQLIPMGQWQHAAYGEINIGPDEIAQFKKNFDAKLRNGVYITAGHEGGLELPAQGWITEVYAMADGLWGDIDWNDLGKTSLADKQYKFVSPEFYPEYEDPETHEVFENVLTGAALTKAPYFKELAPIVFSEKVIKKFTDNTMTLELKDIVTKSVETLSDEEKAFVVEHKAELTPEQTTAFSSIIDVAPAKTQEELDKEKGDANEAAGLNRDGSAKPVEASEKKFIQVDASELAILRAKADKGDQAFRELRTTKINAEVTALIFSESNKAGRFLPKSKDSLRAFMDGLNEDQLGSFKALMSAVPATGMFNEVGDGNAREVTTFAEIERRIATKQTASPKLSYSEGLKQVMSEAAAAGEKLEQQYDDSLPKAKGEIKA